ncbi:hypothetical protein TNCV_2863981 [Trichonephila clavipes]|nr:hypothetical protein TNCV_2863981 [Trichonephila clavipes]
MGPKCTSRLPKQRPKQCVGCPQLPGPSFPGTRVSTHGKHMGDSSPIEAKSIRVAQASEGEPSLPEWCMAGDEIDSHRLLKSLSKRKIRLRGILLPVLVPSFMVLRIQRMMMNDENFPPLALKKPPDPTESSMDTEHPATDQEKCNRMLSLEEEAIFVFDRLNFLNLTLARMNASKNRKLTGDFERIQKEAEQQESLAEQQKGELLSLGSCPIQDCQFHSNLNAMQILKQRKEEAPKFQLLLASNISNSNSNDNDSNTPKNQEIKKKTNRVENQPCRGRKNRKSYKITLLAWTHLSTSTINLML